MAGTTTVLCLAHRFRPATSSAPKIRITPTCKTFSSPARHPLQSAAAKLPSIFQLSLTATCGSVVFSGEEFHI